MNNGETILRESDARQRYALDSLTGQTDRM